MSFNLSNYTYLKRFYGRCLPTACILAIFASTALLLSWKMNMWEDEGYTIISTNKGIIHAASNAIAFENQPPLYFMTIAAWRKINNSLFWMRVFSLLCVMGSAWIFYGFTKKNSSVSPLLFLLLYCLNPLILWAATEARVYGFNLFFASAFIWSSYELFVKKKHSAFPTAIFFIASILGIYTHYFLSILIISLFVWVCASGVWKDIRRLFYHLAVIILAGFPVLIIAFRQLGQSPASTRHPVGIIPCAIDIGQIIVNDFIPVAEFHAIEFKVFKILVLITCVTILFFYRKHLALDRFRAPLARRLALDVCLGTLLFCLIELVLGAYFIFQRHLIIFIPELLLLFLIMAGSVPNGKVRSSVYIVIGVFLLAGGINRFHSFKKPGDWVNVALYIKSQARPDEPIFIYNCGQEIPFRYHFNGVNAIVPLPQEETYDRFDVSKFQLKDSSRLSAIVNSRVGPGQTCWFIVPSPEEYNGIHLNTPEVKKFLDQRFETLDFKEFYRTRVYHRKNQISETMIH